MTSEEIVLHDRQRTIRNAWSAAELVRRRIHNGAGSSLGEVFLGEYLSSSVTARKNAPDFHYFKKLEAFIAEHYDIGPKHMEFFKDACLLSSGSPCPFHQDRSQGIKVTQSSRRPCGPCSRKIQIFAVFHRQVERRTLICFLSSQSNPRSL